MSKHYHKLSQAEKRRLNQSNASAPPERCPHCGAASAVSDLLTHAATCKGQRPQHHLHKWLTWREALARGVPKRTLARWAKQGRVARKHCEGRSMYLDRDIVVCLAARRASGGTCIIAATAAIPRRLTLGASGGTRKVMGQPLADDVIARLGVYIESAGGMSPAARRLDVPRVTLYRAMAGDRLLKGTRLMISAALDEVEA